VRCKYFDFGNKILVFTAGKRLEILFISNLKYLVTVTQSSFYKHQSAEKRGGELVKNLINQEV